MLFKRMDYCEINRQREPAQVFNNYCESGPARGHCSCVASVAPVEYLSSSLPPLSSPPLLQSVHYQCLLPRVRATAGRRGGRATGGRPRPAPAGTEDCLFSWRQNILVRQSGSGTGTGDGGAVTVRTPGVGGGGELDTLQIYLDVLYIISLYHYNNLKLHSQFIVHLELLFYCFIIVAM